MRVRNPFRALLTDERGVSMIELGLLAPFLGVLLMGSIDLGRGLSERYMLQQAAHRTIELANVRALTASQDADEIDFTFLKQEAATVAGVPVGQVTLTRWVECDGEVQEDYSMVCNANEQVARYIQLEIQGSYDPMFKLATIYPRRNADGSIPMMVEAAVRIQ